MSNSGSRDTVLLDDAKLIDCRNGAPADGSVLKESIDAFVINSCRYRPIFTMWGGPDLINLPDFIRQLWAHTSPAAPGLAGMFLSLPSTGAVDVNQAVRMSVDATVDYSSSPPAPFDASNPLRYPDNVRGSVPLSFPMSSDNARHEMRMGSNTTNGPQLRSAVAYEKINSAPSDVPTDAPQAPRDSWLTPGSWILGTDAADVKRRSMRAYRDYYRRVMKARRLAFGWSSIIGGVAPYDKGAQIPFSGHRYIFDTGYGEGATAPTISSPGLTVPLYRSGMGKHTAVRLYVSVYAKMVGGGTGTLRYYHRADDGVSMVGPLTLANSPTISGAGYLWYGGGAGTTLNEAADTYLLGNATLPYDRIVLCGAGSGGTLDIGAISVHAYHSEQ